MRRLLIAAALILLLIAGLVLPPLINISRYQRRVTALISRSLGRPVHLSGIELRLLPMPGFVLHDLSVSEDPAFGPEPVLSARSVVATVAIFPLWQGKLQISRISVDEASLNLVRSPQGRWTLESLMMVPAQ
jgi:AsmA protein